MHRWPQTWDEIAQGSKVKPNKTVFLKEHSNTMAPNDICYICRSVPCSVIIREASSCNKWEQIHRLTSRHYAENEKPWFSQPHMGYLHENPPFRDQRTLHRKRQIEYKSHRGWRAPREQDSLSQHYQCSYQLAETEANAQGLPMCVPGSLHIY